MEDFPKNQENVSGNTGAEILAEMPAFEEHKTIKDKYAAKEFNASIYEGTIFARDYDFDDEFYVSRVKITPAYSVERPAIEKNAIRLVADHIMKNCDPENDNYNTQIKNVTKMDVLHNLFEGQSLERQTTDTLKRLSDGVDDILAQEDARNAKINIRETGVLHLVCIDEVRRSMTDAYEQLQNI